MGRFILIGAAVGFAFACSEEPPGTGGPPPDDAGAVLFCDETTPCPGESRCVAGVCEKAPLDAGTGDAGGEGARMQVCTPDGCEPPWSLDFGGSRIGVSTSQTVTVRSIGTLPLELHNIEVRTPGSEFTADPSGDVELVLQPGEETAIRVTHVARDGIEDNDSLEIISNGQMVRTAIQLKTDYKGVPSLYVGADPASNAMDVRVVDFGTVRAGATAARTLYVKNKDRVIDGSILEVREARIDPASSSNFEVALDRTLPAFLSQFDALCNTDANCRQDLGDACDPGLGVCVTTDGPIRDVLTAEVRFVGITAGVIEEDLALLTNDGGGGTTTITRVVLRANVTDSAITVSPDPVSFPEAFLGFVSRQTVTVANEGSAPLTLTAVALAQTGTFTLDLSALTLPWTVPPSTSSDFDVVYAPPSVGSHATVLTIASDDPALPIRSINVTGNAFTSPELELTPPSIDFGDTHTQVGGVPSATAVVTARNVGGHELRVSSIMTSPLTPPGFTVDPSALPPIPPGQQATFNVRYSPLAPSFPNVESGQVVLITNDPRVQPDLRVPIAGRGVNPNVLVLPGSSVNFNSLAANPNAPSVYRGQLLSTQLTVLNGGFGPATVSSVALVGDTRGAFSISGVPSGTFLIDSGSSVILTAGYAGPAAGADGATIEVHTNDLDLPGGILSISLIGSTSECPAVAGADGLASGAGVCSYTCRTNFYDLNGDLNAAGSNGCEYACMFQGSDDLPDDAYVDRNCDGIDGDLNGAVFVSPLGSDANPGTSPALPVRTVAYAVALAGALGRDVYAASGSYAEAQTLNLPDGVSIYGGFSAIDFRARSNGNITSLAVTQPIAIRVTNAGTNTVLDHLTISGADNPAAGGTAYGIFATSSNGLVVRHSTVIAGHGGAGVDGSSPGGVAASGGAGASGQPGCEDSGGFCSGCSRPRGGGGGGSACGRTGGTGGQPGHGGGWGDTGGAGTGGTPGGPGAPNGQGNWNTPSGYWGATGSPGGAGADGGAGQPAFGASGYAPTAGGGGGSGVAGNAGGGGAGGGGGDDDCDSYGGGGGGGGGGGCGGSAATGGSSAGGSIAILSVVLQRGDRSGHAPDCRRRTRR